MKIKRVLELTNEERNACSDVYNMLSFIAIEDEEETFCDWINDNCNLPTLCDILKDDPVGCINDLKRIFNILKN